MKWQSGTPSGNPPYGAGCAILFVVMVAVVMAAIAIFNMLAQAGW